jgi:hypothetical protein
MVWSWVPPSNRYPVRGNKTSGAIFWAGPQAIELNGAGVLHAQAETDQTLNEAQKGKVWIFNRAGGVAGELFAAGLSSRAMIGKRRYGRWTRAALVWVFRPMDIIN